jgi:hypothetical protein
MMVAASIAGRIPASRPRLSVTMMNMKKLILTLTLFLAAAAANAQYSYGGVEDFYEANPDLVGGRSYAGRFVNPNYLLAEWARHNEMDSRLTSAGFVRLGVSNWQRPNYINGYYYGGVPQKELAIRYAQTIGAAIVIYSVSVTNDDQTEHWVSFFAKQGSEVQRLALVDEFRAGDPTWNDLNSAEGRLQAAWNRLPARKKNQLRASERSWIVDKDAAPPARRLQMINERTAWLLQQG